MELAALQWGFAGGVSAITLLVTGSISVAVPAAATLAVGSIWPWARSIRPTREQTNRLSRRAAAVHGLFAPTVIGLLAAARPAWFEGAVPAATALAAALLAGMAGFALTLCGLSITTGTWGRFNGSRPS